MTRTVFFKWHRHIPGNIVVDCEQTRLHQDVWQACTCCSTRELYPESMNYSAFYCLDHSWLQAVGLPHCTRIELRQLQPEAKSPSHWQVIIKPQSHQPSQAWSTITFQLDLHFILVRLALCGSEGPIISDFTVGSWILDAFLPGEAAVDLFTALRRQWQCSSHCSHNHKLLHPDRCHKVACLDQHSLQHYALACSHSVMRMHFHPEANQTLFETWLRWTYWTAVAFKPLQPESERALFWLC